MIAVMVCTMKVFADETVLPAISKSTRISLPYIQGPTFQEMLMSFFSFIAIFRNS